MNGSRKLLTSRLSKSNFDESKPDYSRNSVRRKKSMIPSFLAEGREKEDFSPEHAEEMMKRILQKKPGFRTEADIDFLVKVTESIDFLRNLEREMGISTLRGVCKHLRLQVIKENTEIFHKGSVGDKFYIMLKGSAGVFLYMPKDSSEQGKKNFVLTEVNTIKAGMGFGELALINDQPRSATVTCKEDCILATLDKITYKDLLEENEKKKFNEQFAFISAVPYFAKMDPRELFTLVVQFKKQAFTMNHVIYREGDEPERFYLILDGCFKLSRIATYEEYSFKEKFNLLRPYKNVRRNIVELGVLCRGQVFGDEEFLTPGKRRYTVTCKSATATVFFISKEEFNMHLHHLFHTFRAITTQKEEWHKLREVAVVHEVKTHINMLRGASESRYEKISLESIINKSLSNCVRASAETQSRSLSPLNNIEQGRKGGAVGADSGLDKTGVQEPKEGVSKRSLSSILHRDTQTSLVNRDSSFIEESNSIIDFNAGRKKRSSKDNSSVYPYFEEPRNSVSRVGDRLSPQTPTQNSKANGGTSLQQGSQSARLPLQSRRDSLADDSNMDDHVIDERAQGLETPKRRNIRKKDSKTAGIAKQFLLDDGIIKIKRDILKKHSRGHENSSIDIQTALLDKDSIAFLRMMHVKQSRLKYTEKEKLNTNLRSPVNRPLKRIFRSSRTPDFAPNNGGIYEPDPFEYQSNKSNGPKNYDFLSRRSNFVNCHKLNIQRTKAFRSDNLKISDLSVCDLSPCHVRKSELSLRKTKEQTFLK